MWVVDLDAEYADHLRMPDQLAPGDPPHRSAARIWVGFLDSESPETARGSVSCERSTPTAT